MDPDLLKPDDRFVIRQVSFRLFPFRVRVNSNGSGILQHRILTQTLYYTKSAGKNQS